MICAILLLVVIVGAIGKPVDYQERYEAGKPCLKS